MKILYAIQGTGNGHLSRARDIIPILKKKGEVDLLVSGTQADISLPYDVKYKLKGVSFIFGKKGGVDLLQTFKKLDTKSFWEEVKTLPVHEYDLIINDFEPISAWAAKLNNIPCIGLSHQSAVLRKEAPRPSRKDWKGEFILKSYAPTKISYGFHFQKYDDYTFTPVIRQQVRDQGVEDLGHYTVYLPSYSDEKLIKKLSHFKGIQWHVFSKHSKNEYQTKNITIKPIDNEEFIQSMATCKGVFCGAGFETPAEALFLGKKLLVIPMKNQYEQHCNAAALKTMGVPVLKNLKEKRFKKIKEWLKSNESVPVNYPNNTGAVIDLLFEQHFEHEKVADLQPVLVR